MSIIENFTSIKLFTAACAGYGCTLFLYCIVIASGKRTLLKATVFFISVSFITHTLGLVSRWIEFNHPPLANMYEYLTAFAWFIAIAYFAVLRLVKNALVEALTVVVILLFMSAASLLPKEGTDQLMPALRSYWLQIHVTMAAASEGAFAVGFVSSILYLLKIKLPDAKRFALKLPTIATLDMITYRSIAVGYPLFTIGALFAGAVWAHRTWGTFWSWDPKETCSLVVWIIYSAYLHLRIVRGSQGKAPHILSIIGFTIAVLTFLSSLILGGLHSYL